MRPLVLLALLFSAAPAGALCQNDDKECLEKAKKDAAALATQPPAESYQDLSDPNQFRPTYKTNGDHITSCGGLNGPPCPEKRIGVPGSTGDGGTPPGVASGLSQSLATAQGLAAVTQKVQQSASMGSQLGGVVSANLMTGAADGRSASRAPALRPEQYEEQADQFERSDNPAAAAPLFLQAGQPRKAEESAIRTLAREPKNPDALATLAAAQAQQGRADEAIASAKQALSLDPHNALAGLIVGHAEDISKGGAEAAKKLTKLEVGQFTGGVGAEGFLGGASGGGKDAVVVGPSGAGAVYPARTGPQPEAPLYDTAVPLSSAQQLTLKALDMHKGGDDQGALLALTQALDQEPGNAGAFVVRAEVENAMQSYPAAIVDAQKAVQLAPNNPPLSARALRAQSYAQIQTGDWTAALASASRSLELDSKSGLGYLYRGMAEDKLGRGDAATRDLAQAISLDSTLQPLAMPLLEKYGLTNTPLTAARVDPRLLRGGLIAGSLLLVLLGLLGTTAGRKAVTTAVVSWKTGAPARGPVATADIRIGDSLGGYKIVRELGRGGMGVVYEGLDETLQRRVAIKRMQTEQGADLQRFLREARLVAQLKHPRVAEIYNVIDAGAEPLLVFEFIEGRPLDLVLRDARKLQPAQARRVIDEVCDALAYAHSRQIIHRDLKPANVMIGPDGACKVMDFGIAHQSTGGRTMTQTVVCGTPSYMAPEQGFGSVSKASDLFALGVMAYELLTGLRPFDGSDFVQAKMEGRFTPATELAPALPRGIDAFFARALAGDPAKRFSDAAEFRDAFARSLDTTPVPLS